MGNTCVNCWKRTRMHTNVNSLAPSRTALLLIPLKIRTSKPMPLSVRIPQDLQKPRRQSPKRGSVPRSLPMPNERLRYRRQRMNFWPKLKLRRINLKHAIVIVHPCESINVRRGAFGFQKKKKKRGGGLLFSKKKKKKKKKKS